MAVYDQSDPDEPPRSVHTEPEDSSQLSASDICMILGLAVPASRQQSPDSLLACPTLVRLESILGNADAATSGELCHIGVCPDCVSRVRAFRRLHHQAAAELFEERLDAIRDANPPFTPPVAEAEGHARLMFLMIAQDADPERWQTEAWRCTRKIPAALRIAQSNGATTADLELVIELYMTAIGAAASNPVATCSRVTDGTWPVVEMIRHTATEVALIDPALFSSFARSLGSAVRMATPRMKVMAVYAMVDLLERGILPAAFAPTLVRQIAGCDLSDGVRVVLATLLHGHRDLPAELRSAVSDVWSNPRVDDVFRSLARGRHAIEAALNTARTPPRDAVAAVLAIVDRFRNDLFDAVEPETAMLRLIALRRLLTCIGRQPVPDRVSKGDLFTAITDQLLEAANRRPGSTFYAIEACGALLEIYPPAFHRLADMLPTARFILRQGVVAAIAYAYLAAQGGEPQSRTARFVRNGHGWTFVRGAAEHPLDALCTRIAAVSGEGMVDHLRWVTRRLDRYAAAVDGVASL